MNAESQPDTQLAGVLSRLISRWPWLSCDNQWNVKRWQRQ